MSWTTFLYLCLGYVTALFLIIAFVRGAAIVNARRTPKHATPVDQWHATEQDIVNLDDLGIQVTKDGGR